MAGALLLRSSLGCYGIHSGSQLLRRIATAGLGTAGVVVRAGVDCVVRDDGGVVWLIWRRGGWGGARGALSVFVLQLGLNGLWSWLFFAWHMGAWAFADIVALWLALVATIVTFARHSRGAAWLLVPYLLWVSFAAALNYAVWQLNPQLLG